MKPMSVNPGEYAPDVDEMVEQVNTMIEKIANLRDDSQIRNITGVEEAPMNHYWTNQYRPESSIEDVTNKGAISENHSLIQANPHQTGSTLAAHENSAGGEGGPSTAYTYDRSHGSSDVQKSVRVVKAGDPLAALLGGAGGDKGGGAPPPDLPPPELPPKDGAEDDPSDPEGLASKIKDLVDRLKDLSGPSDEGGPPLGDAPPPAGPPLGGPAGPPGM